MLRLFNYSNKFAHFEKKCAFFLSIQKFALNLHYEN